MTENKELETNNMSAPSSEAPTPQEPERVNQKLITLKGITTSRVEQALKADNPYPARVFLRLTKRFCQHCEEVEEKQSKCGREDCGYYDRNCNYLAEDIPIFFRIKEKQCQIEPCSGCGYHPDQKVPITRILSCQIKQLKHRTVEVWTKPKIPKGSYLQVEGHFDNPINSPRKSFTAYSYQLLNQELNQQITYDKK